MAGRNWIEEVLPTILGCAPEREQELQCYVEKYSPHFEFNESNEISPKAGLYKFISFSRRTLEVTWFGAHIAWEAYQRAHILYCEDPYNGNFETMLKDFEEFCSCPNFSLPDYVTPMTQAANLESISKESTKATIDLAIISLGWMFLHEIRHIQHQQDETSSSLGTNSMKHNEEFDCDHFATDYLLSKLDIYCTQSTYPRDTVFQKRATGIYFSLFTMVLLSKSNWGASETHPAMQERINKIMEQLGANGNEEFNAIGHAAFMSLNDIWGNVPATYAKIQPDRAL